jgi:hypothetical protein
MARSRRTAVRDHMRISRPHSRPLKALPACIDGFRHYPSPRKRVADGYEIITTEAVYADQRRPLKLSRGQSGSPVGDATDADQPNGVHHEHSNRTGCRGWYHRDRGHDDGRHLCGSPLIGVGELTDRCIGYTR